MTARTSKSSEQKAGAASGIKRAALLDRDDDVFPRGLLSSFLRVKGNSFFYVSTVGDVGRWDIRLFDFRSPQVGKFSDLQQLCDNAYNWKYSDRYRPGKADRHGDDFDEGKEKTRHASRASTPLGLAKGTTWLTYGRYGNESNERCTIQIYRGEHDFVNTTIHFPAENPLSFTDNARAKDSAPMQVGDVGVPFRHFYPPQTKLTDLSPANNQQHSLGTPYSRPKLDNSDGYWRLDDSKSEVSIQIKNGDWEVRSKKPTAAMLKDGIHEGTLLFKGAQKDDRLSGTAFMFKAGCSPIQIAATSTLNNNRVVQVRGTVPTVRANCARHSREIGYTFSFEPSRMMI